MRKTDLELSLSKPEKLSFSPSKRGDQIVIMRDKETENRNTNVIRKSKKVIW
jgi:hypothetical protein